MLSLIERPRRNRKSDRIRAMCQETVLMPRNLVHPLFIHDKTSKEEIPSMPGCFRHSSSSLLTEVEKSLSLGISAIALFPAIDAKHKSDDAREAKNPDGLIPKSVALLKKKFPEMIVVTDVALDPYSSSGHDGVLNEKGEVANDETVELLVSQALCQAEAGADIVAPSDMMDGRVGAIRLGLDEEGFTNVSILSYCAKYASSFYGPFRDALASAPRSGDKKSYQMNPANAREALRELVLDEQEGADILMVKPAGYYLDIIREFRNHTTLPIAAYQVSGEYAMLKAASEKGWLREEEAVLESLLCIRRAGADIIFTYYAQDAAQFLTKL